MSTVPKPLLTLNPSLHKAILLQNNCLSWANPEFRKAESLKYKTSLSQLRLLRICARVNSWHRSQDKSENACLPYIWQCFADPIPTLALNSNFLSIRMVGVSSDGLSSWLLATHDGVLYWILSTQLWPGSLLAAASIWGVNQQMGVSELSSVLFRYPSLAASQINKQNLC